MNKIFNDNAIAIMDRMIAKDYKVDLIVTAKAAFLSGIKEGAKLQQKRMITQEAYESTQVMIKASNEGFLSKIKELEDQINRMYSEEEVLDLLPEFAAYTLINADEDSRLSLKDWFEQFKKK